MILVTGGTGLVGSHLIAELVKRGEQVRAIKRNSGSLKIFERNSLKTFSDQVDWVEGDVTDIYSILDALDGVDRVYHCAALVSFSPSDIDKLKNINIDGTANVVNACLEKGIKKLCHVSSVAALGRTKDGETINEDNQWSISSQNSFYAVSKFGAEREVWRGTVEGLPAVIVNPSIILGPGEWEKGSSKIFNSIYKGMKYYTHGINGFVDVRDVVNIMIKLMDSDVENERFVVNSENLEYYQLFKNISDNLQKPVPKIEAKKWMGELVWRLESVKKLITGKDPLITKETARTASRRYYYDSSKVRSKLGYQFISMEESVKYNSKLFLAQQVNS